MSINDKIRQEKRELLEKHIKDQSKSDWRDLYVNRPAEDRRNETTGY